MKKFFLLLYFLFLINFKQVNAQCTVLVDCNGAWNGSYPVTNTLISDGTFLYGTTWKGGVNNSGTIFKIKPNGTGYAKLMDFADPTNPFGSSFPSGALFFDGTYLYGTASYGGTYSHGTVFKIMPNGSGFTQLWIFGNGTDGVQPLGSLISDGTFLYGTTSYGGIKGLGTLFKIMPNGTGYLKIHDFTDTLNGNFPGELVFDGTYLYGNTGNGGASNVCFQGCGTLFKIKPDGSGFLKLLDFDSINGSQPSSLFYDGIFLYGTTVAGGANDRGTIFKIKGDGSNYTKLLDFTGGLNGSYGGCTLIADSTFLYGTTPKGGSNNIGTVFKIMPDGSNYTKLLDFTATIGDRPGSLFSDGIALYGTTYYGGTNNLGTVFKLDGVLGVNDKNNNIEISLFPNPANEILKIEIKNLKPQHAILKLVNIMGEELLTREIKKPDLEIDVSAFPNGIYFLKISDGEKNFSKKVVVQH
jgi:uncharacterized repeat protein (TIGR03803 family)